jgi:hypothetical protein
MPRVNPLRGNDIFSLDLARHAKEHSRTALGAGQLLEPGAALAAAARIRALVRAAADAPGGFVFRPFCWASLAARASATSWVGAPVNAAAILFRVAVAAC